MKLEDAVEYSTKLLDFVGLNNVKNVCPLSLQPSQLKRLEIAGALACRPKIILPDESAAGVRGKEIDEI